jgi:hypothetical protein
VSFSWLFETLPHGESERQSVRLIATKAATRQSVGNWISWFSLGIAASPRYSQ